jgi:hypothetical protein
MKNSFLGSVALFVLTVSGSAHAADMPLKAPPAAAPPYDWSGFYFGANFGGAWTNGRLNIPGNNLYGGITEFIGTVAGRLGLVEDPLAALRQAWRWPGAQQCHIEFSRRQLARIQHELWLAIWSGHRVWLQIPLDA